jgi:hypothetical protein
VGGEAGTDAYQVAADDNGGDKGIERGHAIKNPRDQS